MLAAVDESQDNVAQSRQGETQPRASFPVLAQGLDTAAEVNEMQAAAASRHCHKRKAERSG